MNITLGEQLYFIKQQHNSNLLGFAHYQKGLVQEEWQGLLMTLFDWYMVDFKVKRYLN